MSKDLPGIKLLWIRGKGNIDFKSPKTHLGLGLRGSGKSSNLECIGCRYPKVIDLFGSRDNEGLAWLRSPWKKEVLLITGDSVEVGGPWDSIHMSKLKLKDVEPYRIVVSVSAFYSNIDEEFYSLNELILKTLWARSYWGEPWYLMIREAANFIYSRIRIVKNQTLAKADFIHVYREARHLGYAVGVDTVRWTSIDKEIRDLSDYLYIKRVGVLGLPKDLSWIYSKVDPDSLMNPGPSLFILVCSTGPVALGKFEYPAWHKREKEDILKAVGLEGCIKHGELPQHLQREIRGSHQKVQPVEHIEILEKYLDLKNMGKVAAVVKRSSGTVHNHIVNHNREVRSFGACSRCERMNHELQGQIIEF